MSASSTPSTCVFVSECSFCGGPPVAPPAPPAPPALTDSEDFNKILKLVVADAGVARSVGSPARVVSEVDGTFNVASDGGKAVLEFELAGPKGRNTVHVNAVSNGGVWKISNLVLTPPGA